MNLKAATIFLCPQLLRYILRRDQIKPVGAGLVPAHLSRNKDGQGQALPLQFLGVSHIPLQPPIRFAFLLFTLAALLCLSSDAYGKTWRLTWHDEFNGKQGTGIDQTKWT